MTQPVRRTHIYTDYNCFLPPGDIIYAASISTMCCFASSVSAFLRTWQPETALILALYVIGRSSYLEKFLDILGVGVLLGGPLYLLPRIPERT